MTEVKGERFPWIDFAKGLCIAFVVLGHTVEWFDQNFTPQNAWFWESISLYFKPLRMPLFFMISGLLVASKMQKAPSALWDKTVGLYLIYCFWTFAYCLKLALPGGRDGLAYPGFDQVILMFALPATLWYIWALPAFCALAYLLERVFGKNSIYALAPAFAFALASHHLGDLTLQWLRPPLEPAQIEAVLYNFLWFYAGIKGKEIFVHVVQAATVTKAAISSICFLGLSFAFYNGPAAAWLLFVPTLAGLWFAAQISGTVNHGSWIAKAFSAIGRKTLPVYVMHTFLLTGLTFVVKKTQIAGFVSANNFLVEIFLPLAVAAVAIAICRTAGSFIENTPVLKYTLKPLPLPSLKSSVKSPSTS